MAEFVETYRGGVKAWECDSFGHFTVAYYFDRFNDISAATRAGLREAGAIADEAAWLSHEFRARFKSELRAGDGLHALSGVIEAGDGAFRLGHKLVNSATGELATTLEESLRLAPGARPLAPAQRRLLDERRVPWEAETAEASAGFDDRTGFMTSARDVVQAWETDASGGLALPFYVHRTSGASLQLLGAIGLTPAYMRAAKRGFATFEIVLRLDEPRPRAGARVLVESALLHMGGSSIRMLHRLREAAGARVFATLSQAGAHFDLATRRSTPIPDELRAKAAPYLVAPAR